MQNIKTRLIIKNKKALLGSIMITFLATIAIVILLLGFVLLSAIFKKFSGNYEGTVVVGEGKVGITNMDEYSNEFINLVSLRANLIDKSFLEKIPDLWQEIGFKLVQSAKNE